ncbi:fatty acid desaturase [Bradyrhizobium sp. AZCC 2262]|uniref:fatty acid desaturase n=1 Tax=Bradyrhizobium sp. AZCC 2262 TaxID=3117022 RepID=UPI002FF15B04
MSNDLSLDNQGPAGAGTIGSDCATHRLMLAAVRVSTSESWFERHDGPTLLVAAAIYAGWLFLLTSHAYVPWWITAPLAGYIVQWHFSLQHEAIHSMRGIPKWLRRALVWPPIGIWFPFELYRQSHARHHRNDHLTYPGEDTESYYHEEEDWEDYGSLSRWLLIVNQTFLGRLFVGPLLRTPHFLIKEARKILAGDLANLGIWVRHLIGVALVLLFVAELFETSAFRYLAEFVYPGLILGMMRSFTEHRWGERPGERTAVVESNWVFGLLFLWNNLHVVHHTYPTLPWWKVPRVWREHRELIQAHNGGFVFRGYGEIARRWLVTPNFIPVHPPSFASRRLAS